MPLVPESAVFVHDELQHDVAARSGHAARELDAAGRLRLVDRHLPIGGQARWAALAVKPDAELVRIERDAENALRELRKGRRFLRRSAGALETRLAGARLDARDLVADRRREDPSVGAA